jgi:hypothetical protein
LHLRLWQLQKSYLLRNLERRKQRLHRRLPMPPSMSQ